MRDLGKQSPPRRAIFSSSRRSRVNVQSGVVGVPPDVTRLEDLADDAGLTPDELRCYLWREIERRDTGPVSLVVGPDGKVRRAGDVGLEATSLVARR
jgi:hypothetical protein